MIAVEAFSVLIAAIVLHELAHYVLLRRIGARPRLTARAWGLKGVGWAFSRQGLDQRQLPGMWLQGPLVEVMVWCAGAILFPALASLFLLVMAVSFLGNMLLPGSDGRRALKVVRQLRLASRTGGHPPLTS